MVENEVLLNIKGGGITPSVVNALTRLVATVLDLGKTVGSSIRRITSGKLCSIRQ